MLEEKISIIVPVYNNEKYLERCIVSLINQTYKNLEIILINDGSTDNSRIICEKYLKKDKRVILVNQKNGGVSAARNKGIEIATGSWIGFVDSDDWIKNDMYEILYRNAIDSAASISICGYIRVASENCNFKEKRDLIILNKEESLLYLILDKEKYATSACNKLYKINLVKDVVFDKKIKYGEDMLFNFNIMMNNTEKVVFDSDIKYFYFYNKYSATGIYTFNKEMLTELDIYKIMLKKVKDKNYKFLEKHIYYIYQKAIVRILLNLTKIDTRENRALYYNIRKMYRKYLKPNKFKVFIKTLIIFLPYDFSRIIYKLLIYIIIKNR